MRDVFYQKNRQGLWVFKAMTDRAKAEMRKLLEVPPELGEEVFMHATDKDFNFVRTALVRSGLTVDAPEDEKPVRKEIDVRSYTEF